MLVAETWRIVKRVVFLLMVVFLGINLVTWVVLNSPPVQKMGLKWVNQVALKPYNLELTWNTLSLNLFSSKLNLQNAHLRFVDPKFGAQESSSIKIKTFSVGLDVLGTYLKRELVLRSAELDGLEVSLGVDADGKIILPTYLTKQSDPSKPDSTVPVILSQIRQILPPEVSLQRSRILIGKNEDFVQADLMLKNITVLNFKAKTEFVPLTVSVSLNESKVRWSKSHQGVEIKNAKLDFKLSNRLKLESLGIDIDSSLGVLRAKGNAELPWSEQDLKYKIDAEAKDLDLDILTILFDLKSKGTVDFKGQISSQDVKNYIPFVDGKAHWRKANIQGIEVYSGEANLSLKNKTLNYKNAKIETVKGGKIQASGSFLLENEFTFQSKAQIESLSFLELLGGFGVQTEAMEANLASAPGSTLEVQGKIRGNGKSSFQLSALGKLLAQELNVPSMEKGNTFSLPRVCGINVEFKVDLFGLNLDGTQFFCRPDSQDLGRVQYGRVDFIDGKTEFNLELANADLSSAAYFLGWPTRGEGSVVGRVYADAKTPVSFVGKVQLKNVLLYGVSYDTLVGELDINGKYTAGKNFKGTMAPALMDESAQKSSPSGQKSGLASVELERFKVDYGSDLLSQFEGRLFGDLHTIRKSALGALGENFPKLVGKIQEARVSILGPLLQPKRWKLKVGVSLEDFGFETLIARRVDLVAECESGNCFRSSLKIAGGSTVGSQRENGQISADIVELSDRAINASLRIGTFPLAILSNSGVAITGEANLVLRMSGPWKSWQGELQGTLASLMFGEKNLGDVSFVGLSSLGSDIDLSVRTRSDQVQGRLKFPHSLDGLGSVYLKTQNFDPAFLLSKPFLKKWNFISQMSSELELTGPSPLTTWSEGNGTKFGWKKAGSWMSAWRGRGQLQNGFVQFNQVILKINDEASFSYSEHEWTLGTLLFQSNYGTVSLSGRYQSETNDLELKAGTDLDLGLFQDLTSGISQASGKVKSSIVIKRFEGEFKTQGSIRLSNGSVSLLDLPPAFTEIEADFVVNDSRLEIQNFTSKKGAGEIELAGSVDFTEFLSSNDRGPQLSLRFLAKNAQFAFPAPFVESFDTVFDATINVSGKSKPYSIAGDVKISKASAFRDKTCQDLLASERAAKAEELGLGKLPFANFNVRILAEKSIVIQTNCLKSNFTASVNLVGNTQNPLLTGLIEANGGSVSFLKSQFTIAKSEFIFDSSVRLDPRVDIQLISKIESYSVFVAVDGSLSKRRTNLWVDPPSTPDGASISRPDIFRMLATGQPPNQVTNQAGAQSQALVAQVAGYFYGATAFDESLSQAAQRLTGGIVESVRLQPVIESGQTRWRARVSRSLGDRLSLGLDIEQGQFVNNQSINGTVYVNESVNVLGGFDRKSEQNDQYYELSGGLRFQFGGGR